MQKVSGKEISRDIIEKLKKQSVPRKILAAVLVGDDPTSASFLKQKRNIAQELSLDFRLYELPKSIKNDEIRKRMGKIALNKKVGGVILQLPLPEGVNKYYAMNVIPKEKDIDVLGERALGAFYHNRNVVRPPSVEVVKEILDRQNLDLRNLCVAVVGLGDLVGKPIGTWLSGKCQELILLDKGGDQTLLKKADLVISGVGQANVIEENNLKEGAGVIDFGYYYSPDGKLSGDFGVDENSHKIGFYTPTPGGTGPILVAKLIENFYKLNGDRE
jgi:5,10-methylene-tetrahydrofolate dehydrogenase/methenyl tetrahydrofolate cyclohydrolase